MAFNPDEFLATDTSQKVGFNPDAFLAEPEKIPQQQAQEPESSGLGFGGIVEPALAIASGVASTVAGGFGGALQTINPFVDEGSGAEAVKGIQEFGTYQPRGEAGKANLKTLGELMQKGIDIANYPISGLGGLLELISGQGIDQAAQTIKDIQNTGVGKTAGSRVLEETGSPLAATIAETAPEALMEVAGVGALQRVRKTIKEKPEIPNTPEGIREKYGDETARTSSYKRQDYKETLGNIKSGRRKEAVIDAMPNQEIINAADELGIDLNPDHYSDNRVFQEVTQSLKSRPGSNLGAIEAKAIEDLGSRADDLIADLGGEVDKSLLDEGIRSDINQTITDLSNQADIAYKSVENVIPRRVMIKPESSRNYITETLDDLGGDKTLLSIAEKKLLSIMDSNPTYSAIDRLRKDVGEGFNKRSGPYKDDSSSNLKQVYKVLSEDQAKVAETFGVGDEYTSAKQLVVQRKGLEDEAVNLFGREVAGSLIPKMTQAATALTKGDTSKFIKLMNALPVSRRQEVSATMLNDMFTQGARIKGSLGGGFVKAWQGLNKNKGAKNILFNQLPVGSVERFDRIGRVSEGIYRSKALENNSRTARDLISAMDDGGLFSKIFSGVGQVARKIPGGSSTLGVAGDIFTKSTSATSKADKFITSTKFKEAIKQSAKKGNPELAEKILKNSKEYNDWLKTKSKAIRKAIAIQGFIGWLVSDEE